MGAASPVVEEKSPGRLFVLSIALVRYAENNFELLLSVFLIDIALTFGLSVGAVSRMGMYSSFAVMLVGLVMSVLSVRYSHKLLLLAGTSTIIVGVVGSFLAPSFSTLAIFFSLEGMGSVIVIAMSYALIGRFLPLEKRARAVGLAVAAGSLSFVIGAPLSVYIFHSEWRSVLLLYFLPVSVAGLVLAYVSIPSTPIRPQAGITKEAYINSLKQVLLNKSAAACLTSSVLFSAASLWGLYAITFYRTRFPEQVSREIGSLILVFMVLSIALGSVVSGRLVNRFGRKRLGVVASLLTSILIAVFVYMPYLWIVLPLDLVSTFLRGIAVASLANLGLEQTPKARGTMMSLYAVFGSLGGVIGIAVAAPVLDEYGFLVLTPVLAAFGIAAVSVIYFFAKDPYKK